MSQDSLRFFGRLRALIETSLEVDSLLPLEVIGTLEQMKLEVFLSIQERKEDEDEDEAD